MTLAKFDIIDLDITSLAYGGMGVSHYNDIVVFVKGGIPGERVKGRIYKKKRNYYEADIVEKTTTRYLNAFKRLTGSELKL